MSDSYVSVTVILRARTPKAIRVSPEADEDIAAWLPRSCIHGADDSAVDDVELGDKLTVRVFEWKARQESLI